MNFSWNTPPYRICKGSDGLWRAWNRSGLLVCTSSYWEVALAWVSKGADLKKALDAGQARLQGVRSSHD